MRSSVVFPEPGRAEEDEELALPALEVHVDDGADALRFLKTLVSPRVSTIAMARE